MKKIFFLFIFLFFIGSNVGKIVAQEIDPVLLQKNTEFDSSVKKREKISVKKNIKKTYSTNEKVKIELFNQDLNDIEVDVKNDKNEKVDVEVTQNDILGVSTVSFNPPPQFRPGEYKIVLKDQLGTTIEQDFVWGVLALNPNKSIYNKDETASLAMAVLDNLGKMVCDAKVKLTITNYELRINDELSTENGKIVVNPECNSKEVITIPDYETKYKLGGIGVYNLELTAITSNGTFVINDKIEVKDNNDFEVERISATRIFPKNEYPMTINIVANRDFSGGIYEEVPENFEISEPKNSQKYSRIIDDGKKKKIFWELDIKKGEKVSLGYQYRAPVISPQFYLVGPLLMTTLTDLAFSEGRQWQVAADDTGPVQIRQEINIIDGTVTSGGTDPATINIDTTKYSGTETYYFEIIANKGAGTTLTVNLSTGNTNSVSIGVSDTTDVRVRKQFTPQTGSFDYRLNLTTGSTPSVKVARIIILQSDTEITATQTQVEVGNREIGLTMATSNDFPFSQGIGNSVSATTGTATVAWPTHVSGDVALLFIETIGGTTVSLSTPNGFVAVTNSPQKTGVGTSGTQLNVYWARATSSSMASPVVKASGDHIFAQIITYRNVVETGDPWDVTIGTTKPTASTTTTFGAVTTTVDNTLVVVAAARDTDSAAAAWTQITNGNLQGINEKTDGGTTSGNGGGFLIANGNLPTAGSTGTMTSTVASSINATMTIALKGKVSPALTSLYSPKYWKYDSSVWDGTLSVTADVTWKKNDTGLMLPFSQGIGNSVSATTGTATVAWPTHVSGDVALLFVETIGATVVSLSTPNGFVAVTNSPQATGVGLTGTQLNVYWARATSSSMASPVVKSAGNHIFAQIITYRNVVETGDPWDVTIGTTKPTASTTTTFGAVTTTVDNTLVVVAAARDTDSAAAAWTQITNGNLQGINEKTDGGTTSGNGGGLLIANGNLPTAGSTGTMTSTVASSINATMTIALKGKVDTSVPATIKIQEDDGAFGGWADKVTILGVGKSSGSIVHSTSVSFTPTTGRNYRIVKTIDNSRGHSLDIYNAKIIIDQSDATKITKLEPQYLMLNTKSTSIGGTLGFANLWDSTEWVRTTNTYKHAADSLSVGTSAQLVDINNSNTLVTGSKIMGVGQTISGNLTMPTTGHNLDTWLLGSGEVDASRILVQVMVNALSDPMPPSANSFQRKTFYDDINSQYWKMSFGGTGIDSGYSNNGTSWTTGSTLPYVTNDFSVWYAAIGDTEFVFVAITDNYDIKIRQGVLTASSVTWNSNVATIFDGAGVSDNYSYPFISLDNPTSGNPHLWVSARYYDGTNYVIKTRSTSSTAEASPSTWTYNSTTQISDNQTNSNVFANIVPLLSGDMYSAFVKATSIEGCRWNNGSTAWQDSVGTSCSGVSGSQDPIASTTGSLSDNISVVSDSSGNIHLELVENLSTDQISYTKLAVGTTTWTSPVLVAANADDNDAYITLTLDSTNNYLYAFWIDTVTNSLYYSFCQTTSGCDSDTEWVAESGQETSWHGTGTNTNLSSNYTGAGKIFGLWSKGTSSPYILLWDDVMAQVASVGPAVDQIMRHGMSFINGVRQNFTF